MYQYALLFLFAGIAFSQEIFDDKVTPKLGNDDFYYWRDFDGKIPKDAFVGGSDLGDVKTYIGLTFFPEKNVLLPTVITPGNRFATVNISNKTASSDKFTKILCSTNNSLFRWVPSDSKKIRYLTGCPQIIVGFQSDAEVSIGRANVQGRLVTGRLFDYPKKGWHELIVHDEKHNDIMLKVYEVLTYKCEVPYPDE